MAKPSFTGKTKLCWAITATPVRSRDPKSKPPNCSDAGAAFSHSTTDRILCSQGPCFETSAGHDKRLPTQGFVPTPPHPRPSCAMRGAVSKHSFRDQVVLIGRVDDHSTSEIAGTNVIGWMAAGFCKPPLIRIRKRGRASPPRPTRPLRYRRRPGIMPHTGWSGFPEAFLPSWTERILQQQKRSGDDLGHSRA